MPRVTGRVTECLSLEPDLWDIADAWKLEADLSCRRNTVSPDTESGKLQALSPRNIQEEVLLCPRLAPRKPHV